MILSLPRSLFPIYFVVPPCSNLFVIQLRHLGRRLIWIRLILYRLLWSFWRRFGFRYAVRLPN